MPSLRHARGDHLALGVVGCNGLIDVLHQRRPHQIDIPAALGPLEVRQHVQHQVDGRRIGDELLDAATVAMIDVLQPRKRRVRTGAAVSGLLRRTQSDSVGIAHDESDVPLAACHAVLLRTFLTQGRNPALSLQPTRRAGPQFQGA